MVMRSGAVRTVIVVAIVRFCLFYEDSIQDNARKSIENWCDFVEWSNEPGTSESLGSACCVASGVSHSIKKLTHASTMKFSLDYSREYNGSLSCFSFVTCV